jgi:intracellular multiplication protein IcmC
MNTKIYEFDNRIKNLFLIIVTLIGLFCCGTVYAQNTGTTTDALQMLIHLSNSYPNITKLIYGAAYLMGLIFMIRAVYMLKVYGEQRSMMSTQTNLRGPITLIVVAAVLMWLPSGLHMMIMTAFGHEYVLQYQTSPSNPLGQAGMYALVYLIQIVGLISFIRGWVYLAQGASGGQGQHTTGKALTHIIGGLLAINVVELTNILWNSFGFQPPFST